MIVHSEESLAPQEAEVGQLPYDWKVVALSDLGGVVTGSTPSTKRIDYYGDEFMFISPADLNEIRYVKSTQKWLSEEGLSAARVLPKNAVLVSCIGYIGKTGMTFAEKSATNQQINAIVCNESADASFVYFLMTHMADFIASRAQKTTVPIINKGNFERLPVILPPLAEQRRIAAVLTTIQDAIAAQEDVIAAARAFKRSLMHRLFTYGPGPVPAEAQETLYGEVPCHWPTELLSDCAYVQTGTAKGRRFSPTDTLIDVPYLRVANVQDGFLDLSEIKTITIRADELGRYKLEPGDVLMTEGGDFDKLGRGFIWRGEIDRCIHQNHVFAVRVNRNVLLPEWLAYLTQSGYGKSYFLTVAHRTTNLASINTTKLKSLPVLVPPLDEQAKVVEMLHVADDKLAAEEDRKTALEALFKSMLHQLMTGQIRLRSDEGLPLTA